MGGGRKRLTHAQKVQVCQWLAEFRPLHEVQGLWEEHFGWRPDHRAVLFYRDSAKWARLIAELRARWTSAVADVSVANARYRLAVIEECLGHALARVRELGADAERFDHAAVVGYLEQARREVEGQRRAQADRDETYDAPDLEIHLFEGRDGPAGGADGGDQ